MRVKVYFNLHRKVWSVLTHTKGKGWRLAFHSDGRNLALENVTFKVSEAGRQRVLREKRKNVHAFAIGTLVGWLPCMTEAYLKPVSYNPYKAGTFMCEGQPMLTAKYALLCADRRVLAGQG